MDGDYNIIDNIIYTPDIKHRPDERGIGWVYYEEMLKRKDMVAQIDGLTGEKENFGSLLQRCVTVAVGLKAQGVRYGDVVSVCTYNHFNSCVPHISSMFVGAKITALDPSLCVPDAIYLYKIVMPKLIFVGEESVALIEDVIREIGCATIVVVFGHTDKYIPFSEFVKPSTDELMFEPVTVKDVKDVAVIMFSSGISGLPKGVCHSHYSILRRDVVPTKFDKGGSVVFMSDTPYWNVFFYTLNYSIKTGTARMVYPKFDFSDPWKVFSQKISTVFLNLTELMTLCNTPKPKEIDISGLELISTAGSPVSINHIAIAKECFPNVLLRIPYGQSEVFMSMTYFNMTIPRHVELMKRKVNSCGLPRPGITFKFVDEGSGKALGPNAKGELRVKTDMQMSGYYNMDSSDAWDEDGWLKTGDYGYYDDDCCFYIIDRVKEMFTYRSWHILPAVLESILITHPAVFRAVVIGVPHDIDEHHPMAIVQLNPDAKVTDAELVKYMEDKVEDRQRLRGGVKFVDEFPLTPSQKINRRILKEMVLQGNI